MVLGIQVLVVKNILPLAQVASHQDSLDVAVNSGASR